MPDGAVSTLTNVTAICEGFSGFLSANGGSRSSTDTSNVNWTSFQVAACSAILPVDSQGQTNFASNTNVNFVVDLQGFFAP